MLKTLNDRLAISLFVMFLLRIELLTIKIVNGVMLFSFRLQSVELSRFAGLWGFNGPFVPG